MRLPEPPAVAAALDAAYAGITGVVTPLDDTALLCPTGCHGWLVVDLLMHLTVGAQRALIALATPATSPADVDFVGYWRARPVACSDTEHAQWVRRTAAAFRQPRGVVQLWRDTAAAAARAAATAARQSTGAQPVFRPIEVAIFTDGPTGGAANSPPARYLTEGRVIALPDLLATFVTEAVIHHLDVIRYLPAAPVPAPEAVAVAVSTVQELTPSGRLPRHWSPHEALLKAAGRAALDGADRSSLGADADRYPLIGCGSPAVRIVQ